MHDVFTHSRLIAFWAWIQTAFLFTLLNLQDHGYFQSGISAVPSYRSWYLPIRQRLLSQRCETGAHLASLQIRTRDANENLHE